MVFNKNIKTTKKIVLYKDKKKSITLYKGINIPIEYQDNSNYYVSFFQSIYSIPKKEKPKIVKNKNTSEKEAQIVAVLNYDKISDSCSGYECINTKAIQNQIIKLKENEYQFITKEEYQSFLKVNINNNKRRKRLF